MLPLRLAALCMMLAAAAQAEQATIAAPEVKLPQYDPTLSAKEAVLANWDLAAQGIRAGEVVGRRVLDLADRGAPYAVLRRTAAQAEKTMVQRWNAAQWLYAGEPDLPRVAPGVLRGAVAAAATTCDAEPCTAETAALRTAFSDMTEQMSVAAAESRAAIEDRMARQDRVLMAEQLSAVADYLQGGAWAASLSLAEWDRDREEVAARLVGAMSIWRNVEPYVGLTSPEIDDAINVAADRLLRTLRLSDREPGPLRADGAELTALRARAEDLAREFRRASALFVS